MRRNVTVCSPGATCDRIFRRAITAGSVTSLQSKEVSAPPSNWVDTMPRSLYSEVPRYMSCGLEQEYRTATEAPCAAVCLAKPSEKKPVSSVHCPTYLHQESFSSIRTEPGPATLRSFTVSA